MGYSLLVSITISISTGSWVGAPPFIAETGSWVGAPSLKAGMVGFRVAAPSVKARTGSRVGAPGFSGPRPSQELDSGWPGSLPGGLWVPSLSSSRRWNGWVVVPPDTSTERGQGLVLTSLYSPLGNVRSTVQSAASWRAELTPLWGGPPRGLHRTCPASDPGA